MELDLAQLARETTEAFPSASDARLRRERLTRMSAMLKRLRPTKTRHFHLATWEFERPCGTAACAVGYAMRNPWFIRRGLRAVAGDPTFRGAGGFDAAVNFFRVSEGDAIDALFYQYFYDNKDRGNPKAVAKRIDAFLVALKAAA